VKKIFTVLSDQGSNPEIGDSDYEQVGRQKQHTRDDVSSESVFNQIILFPEIL
jgi:hypothetical protein